MGPGDQETDYTYRNRGQLAHYSVLVVETTNVLYILSKDSMLRIFELDSSTQRSIDLVRKLSQANKTDHLQWTKIYEMPINTLNFANFIIEAEVKPTKDNKVIDWFAVILMIRKLSIYIR